MDSRRGTFKPYKPFEAKFETVAAIGMIHGYKRKMLIVCSYLPPGMKSHLDCMEEIVGIMNQAKIDYSDPFILIGGGFNEFSVAPILAVCSSLRLCESPPTRHDKTIDLLITNFDSHIKESRALEPLSDINGVESDHNVMF